MIETVEGIRFISSPDIAATQIQPDDTVTQNDDPVFVYIRRDANERPLDVRINFIDQEYDYQSGSIYARDQLAETENIIDMAAPVVLDRPNARVLAEARLNENLASGEKLNFTVGPMHTALECGDVITTGDEQAWLITDMDGQAVKSVSATRLTSGTSIFAGNVPSIPQPRPWIPRPDLVILDIPQIGNDRSGVLVGIIMTPFSPCRISLGAESVHITGPARVGTLLTPLKRGQVGIVDYHSFDIEMPAADLSALDQDDLLGGGNRFAVRTQTGVEVLQARDIILIGANQYRLSGLLRGQFGTDDAMVDEIPAGAEIIKLDAGLVELPIDPERRGETLTFSVSANGLHSAEEFQHTYRAEDRKPLSPVHIRAAHNADHIKLSWVRRTRNGGDQWAGLDVPLGEDLERYYIEILNGDTVIWSADSETQSISVPITVLGSSLTGLTARIAQYSQTYGPGAPRSAEIKI